MLLLATLGFAAHDKFDLADHEHCHDKWPRHCKHFVRQEKKDGKKREEWCQEDREQYVCHETCGVCEDLHEFLEQCGENLECMCGHDDSFHKKSVPPDMKAKFVKPCLESQLTKCSCPKGLTYEHGKCYHGAKPRTDVHVKQSDIDACLGSEECMARVGVATDERKSQIQQSINYFKEIIDDNKAALENGEIKMANRRKKRHNKEIKSAKKQREELREAMNSKEIEYEALRKMLKDEKKANAQAKVQEWKERNNPVAPEMCECADGTHEMHVDPCEEKYHLKPETCRCPTAE